MCTSRVSRALFNTQEPGRIRIQRPVYLPHTARPLWAQLRLHSSYRIEPSWRQLTLETLFWIVTKPRSNNNHLCNAWWHFANQLQGQWPMAFKRKATSPWRPHGVTPCSSCARAPPAQLCLPSMKSTSKCQNYSQAHFNICNQNTKRISWTVVSSVKDLSA